MKYYVVALFDKQSYEVLSPLQRKFSKKYRANRRSPIPHIALDVIETSNIDKITPVIEKVLKPYKRFKVEYKPNSASLNETLKTVNLEIEDRGYIKKIYTALTDNFELSGLNVKFSPAIDDNNIGISLATINHIAKDKKTDSYANQNTKLNESDNINTLKIDRFEIWKVFPNKKEVCLKSFPLKNF